MVGISGLAGEESTVWAGWAGRALGEWEGISPSHSAPSVEPLWGLSLEPVGPGSPPSLPYGTAALCSLPNDHMMAIWPRQAKGMTWHLPSAPETRPAQ